MKYGNITLTTTITLLTLYHLYLLLVVRLGGYIVNFPDFYSYRLIGKLTDFISPSGVQLVQHDRDQFHFRLVTFTQHLKNRVDMSLSKQTSSRITLNLDGVPITSKSHTHPSHSQTSCLLTSSLSLGVPVPRTTQCI